MAVTTKHSVKKGKTALTSRTRIKKVANGANGSPARRQGKQRGKVPSLAELKRRLAAGSSTAVAKAEANARKLIGRSRI